MLKEEPLLMCGFSILSFSFSPSQFVVVASTLTSSSLKYDEYVFPYWANFVGWGIAMSSMLFVPVYAIYKFLSLPGTFKEVSIHGTTVIFQTKTWSRNLHEWTFLSGTVRTRSDKMITWKNWGFIMVIIKKHPENHFHPSAVSQSVSFALP